MFIAISSVDMEDLSLTSVMAQQLTSRSFISRFGEADALVLSLAVGGFAIFSGWLVSRKYPGYDPDLVMTIFGFVLAWGNVVNSDFPIAEYFQPPVRFVGCMLLNVYEHADGAPQFLMITFVGSLVIALLNSVVIRIISLGKVTYGASISIGAILSQPNSFPLFKTLQSAFVSERLLVLMEGEQLFTGIVPIMLQNAGESAALGSDDYNFLDAFLIFVRVNFTGAAVGVFCGVIFLRLISVLSDRFYSSDRVFQPILLVLCAYVSYFAASIGIGHPKAANMSTLAAGAVLAWRMWTHIISPREVKHVWDIARFAGDAYNSFILGVILYSVTSVTTTQSLFTASHMSATQLIMIWICVTCSRIGIMYLLTPVLNWVSESRLTTTEVLVWGWAGTVKGKQSTTMTIYESMKALSCTTDELSCSLIERAFRVQLLVIGCTVTILSMAINAPLTRTVVDFLEAGGRSAASVAKLFIARRCLRSRINDISNVATKRVKCRQTFEMLADPEEISSVSFSDFKEALREIFLSTLEFKYMQAAKTSTRKANYLIEGLLLESTRVAEFDASTRLSDWDHIVTHLPNKNSELVFALVQLLECHRQSQWVMEYDILLNMEKDVDDLYTKDVMAAWAEVRNESNRNCKKARKLLQLMDNSLIFMTGIKIKTGVTCRMLRDMANNQANLKLLVDEDLSQLLTCIATDVTKLDDPLKSRKSEESILIKLSRLSEAVAEANVSEEEEKMAENDYFARNEISHRGKPGGWTSNI